MSMTGDRRRVWRWAVAVWALLVVVGGGLTVWLQDSAEPHRYGWEPAETAGPTPSLPEDWEGRCPPPTPLPTPTGDGIVAYACVFSSG
ncbi:hypothetical protein [Streptomyces sp. TRM68367]|uniref:hypothetical protein n=1 Tax=Streptomyces sp. TRM68367 TaxID=2758415 RepID=UPI00165BBD45|nr:hypothetical protein [Streptomyces sp. TRM68367]MBC9725346.1 hypothetical protein [Streptomyces sp. TRM68367]